MQKQSIAVSLLYVLLGACLGVLVLEGYIRYNLIQMEEKTVHADLAKTRTVVPLEAAKADRMMVALAFGQAGAANAGETPRKTNRKVFNFYDGKLYRAEDPMLGATGDGGSVWSRLGDHLIERELYDSVIFAPIGVSGTKLAQWEPGTELHEKLLESIRALQRSGLAITHLFWHQGETDVLARTSKEAYQKGFRAIVASIRHEGVTAPIYVSVTSRCTKQKPDPTIRQAQEQLVDIRNRIFPGPDTDILGLGDRYDGCHFTDEGLEKVSMLWVKALTEMKIASQL